MSMPHIRHEVEMMLGHVSELVGDAEKKLAGGGARDKVDAAGELVLLKRQKEMIETRLQAILRNSTGTENPFSVMREELFNLSLRFRQFLTGGLH